MYWGNVQRGARQPQKNVRWLGSNPPPLGCESAALPTRLASFVGEAAVNTRLNGSFVMEKAVAIFDLIKGPNSRPAWRGCIDRRPVLQLPGSPADVEVFMRNGVVLIGRPEIIRPSPIVDDRRSLPLAWQTRHVHGGAAILFLLICLEGIVTRRCEKISIYFRSTRFGFNFDV